MSFDFRCPNCNRPMTLGLRYIQQGGEYVKAVDCWKCNLRLLIRYRQEKADQDQVIFKSYKSERTRVTKEG